MMATGHAATGAAIVAPLIFIPGIVDNIFLFPAILLIGAGAALGPDLDHPQATAAHTWGFISKWIAWCVEKVSEYVYVFTRTRFDMQRRGGHRTLTHTLLFAVLTGILVYFVAFNHIANLIIIFLMLCLGLRGLFPKITAKNGIIAVYIVASLLPIAMWDDEINRISPLTLALVITLGFAIHSLGDCLTDSGAPLLFPILINRRLWYRFKTTGFTFSTGSKQGKKIEKHIKQICIGLILACFIVKLILILGV